MSVVAGLLNTARAEIGTYEVPPGSNRTKYGEWYGFNGVAWCAIFLSWVCDKNGVKWRYASTVSSMYAAKRQGIWSQTPRVGWACMRQYTATTGHIGIVEAVNSDGTVTSIEGNTNAAGSREGDGVYRKRRSGTWWSGYINLPALATAMPAPSAPAPTETTFKERVSALPVLQEGSTGFHVKVMQALLIVHAGFPASGIDGIFGPDTKRRLTEWQRATGRLTPDGVCGPATWSWLVGV